MKVALRNIAWNPYRDMRNYRIDQKKVARLVESFAANGFWGGLIGRKVGSKVEIAFGHHRVAALTQWGAMKTVDVTIQKLDDSAMLRAMLWENDAEWSHTAEVDLEAVSSIVKAIGNGDIDLTPYVPVQGKGKGVKIAPSFVEVPREGAPMERRYTAAAISRWINAGSEVKVVGWSRRRVSRLLMVLEALEVGVVRRSDLAGLSLKEQEELASAALTEYRAAVKSGQTKESASAAAAATSSKVADETKAAKEEAVETGRRKASSDGKSAKERKRERKAQRDIDKAVDEMVWTLDTILASSGEDVSELREMAKWKSELSNAQVKRIHRALTGIGTRAAKLATSFEVAELRRIS